MPDVLVKKDLLKGGEFLLKSTPANDIFIPEDFNEEQLMIKDMVRDFLETEVMPNIERIEHQEDDIAVKLLNKMAELGLLGSHMPEQYGGLALDNNTNTLICDTLGPAGSFTVSYAAHTGIGMLPILYFGTPEQKEQYLPGLISGELKAAYCLTEPSSGSDALAAKTRADLSEDGNHYILNGQKMWISNAGFADIYIVFAQIDGDKFTGFIVERDLEGLTLGAEEAKLGIKGSSTRQVFLENVKVPKENVLGEIGKGHLIAFNVLNIGRFKLCALCLGGSKEISTTAVRYANERQQFKVPISSFGAIQYKLAEQAIRIFASESAMYRVSGLLEDKKEALAAEGESFEQAKLIAAEEYAIECSLLKVSGSEVLDYVVDEGLQVHGGMGYSEEGTMARSYRDARINRIFEGTNEINRLLSVDQLFKRAMKGAINFVGAAMNVQQELTQGAEAAKPEGPYAEEYKAVAAFKKTLLMVAGAAAKMQMDGKLNLKAEQELLINLSDIMNDILSGESMLLRIHKLREQGTKEKLEVYEAMLQTFFYDAQARISKNASDALVSFAEGKLLDAMLQGVEKFMQYPAVNVKAMRRKIASTLIEANEYCF